MLFWHVSHHYIDTALYIVEVIVVTHTTFQLGNNNFTSEKWFLFAHWCIFENLVWRQFIGFLNVLLPLTPNVYHFLIWLLIMFDLVVTGQIFTKYNMTIIAHWCIFENLVRQQFIVISNWLLSITLNLSHFLIWLLVTFDPVWHWTNFYKIHHCEMNLTIKCQTKLTWQGNNGWQARKKQKKHSNSLKANKMSGQK